MTVVVGDGEVGDRTFGDVLAFNKFLNPDSRWRGVADPAPERLQDQQSDRAVAHSHEELERLFQGYGYTPYFVEGSDPETMHQLMAGVLETCVLEIRRIQEEARRTGIPTRPRWPMIVLRSPKGWTGPKDRDGHQVEGLWRSHQVPLAGRKDNPAHLKQLEDWLRSYKPEELFDDTGRLIPELAALAPKVRQRMGANPHANGGVVAARPRAAEFQDYAIGRAGAGRKSTAELTRVTLGEFLRDIMQRQCQMQNFRVFGPDENRFQPAGCIVCGSMWTDWRMYLGEASLSTDDDVSPDGRVMEVLSEHLCHGWLEGYLLTGRHGFFVTYEAFVNGGLHAQPACQVAEDRPRRPWREAMRR